MKANLRINFKRICFDAVISRQNGPTLGAATKKKKAKAFAIWVAAPVALAEPLSHSVALS